MRSYEYTNEYTMLEWLHKKAKQESTGRAQHDSPKRVREGYPGSHPATEGESATEPSRQAIDPQRTQAMTNSVTQTHILLANHNGDPQCLCGYMSPPISGVVAAAGMVSKHVKDATK